MKVLICGGGIAGNALAFWLSRLDHDVTLIERFPTLRSSGLRLDLRGHGIEVMRRMKLEKDFRAKSVEEQGLEIVGLQSFSTDFEIMRGDFVELMYDATKHRAKYVFGVSVERFEQTSDDHVGVRFSDGKIDRFDLLVGSDGQGSRTRRMMIGPGTTDPIHFLDSCSAYFTIPWRMEKGDNYHGTSYLATSSRYMLTRRSNDHELQVYLSCKADSAPLKDVQKGDALRQKEAFAEIFHGAGWKTDEILQLMTEYAEDFYCERAGVVKLDVWSKGKTVLVGDAAYCPTQMTGMGTTCGLVGAYILAGEISAAADSSDGLSRALDEYEKKFRPFMDQVQRGAAENSGMDWIPTSAVGIGILNILVGLASFLRLDILSRFVLRENITDWNLPNYEMVSRSGQPPQ